MPNFEETPEKCRRRKGRYQASGVGGRGKSRIFMTHYTNGASPQPDEHVMMPSNLRRDSAWGKAHHFGTTSRTSCDHTLAPVPGTSPYKATAASRIEPASAESQHSRRPLSAAKGRTVSLRSPPQNLTHLHQVSYFKISRPMARGSTQR